jgi:hypothetical protein
VVGWHFKGVGRANSVVHHARCATELVEPMIGAGREWAPPKFCGAWPSGALQKCCIFVVHPSWCATELFSVAH